MTDSARTEEIRARVEKARRGPNTFEVTDQLAVDLYTDVKYLLTELTALREEVERLKGALQAATRCPTCEGTGKMTLECMACLSAEPGARCTCAEETCAQCDGRGWATADGTGEELVATALSPSPAQEPK